MTPEENLEARFHWIPWREPLTVSSPDVPIAFACRFCIALNGLKTEEVAGLPQSREDFLTHLQRAHRLTAVPMERTDGIERPRGGPNGGTDGR